MMITHHMQKFHGEIVDSRLFTWHWIHREIHIPNNPVAFIVCHFVRGQSVKEVGMVRRHREDSLTEEHRNILLDNGDIIRDKIVDGPITPGLRTANDVVHDSW